MRNSPVNILAIRNDRFGEFLLNIPAFRALKESFPQAKLTVMVDPLVKEIANHVPYIDEVIGWENKKYGLWQIFEFSRSLRKKKFDACLILNPTKYAHLLTVMSGIPARAGYNRKWGFLLNYKLKDTKYLGNRHEIECNLELTALLGAKTFNKTLIVNTDDGLFSELTGQKIIAVHPFTSDPIKQWPIEKFKELIKLLTNESKFRIALIGKDKTYYKHFENIQENTINLINKQSLPELASLLKRSSLLISCDSGPVHLASCVGTPVLALFRNDIPAKASKRWGPTSTGSRLIEKGALSEISVVEVFKAVNEMLKT